MICRGAGFVDVRPPLCLGVIKRKSQAKIQRRCRERINMICSMKCSLRHNAASVLYLSPQGEHTKLYSYTTKNTKEEDQLGPRLCCFLHDREERRRQRRKRVILNSQL